MFLFMTTKEKQQQKHPYVFIHDDQWKNDSVTLHVSFDKNDSVTPFVFFHDDQ